jgi:hypothetical protein
MIWNAQTNSASLMRYRLRTLLILLAIVPPLLAIGFWRWVEYQTAQERKAALREVSRRALVGVGWSNLERMAPVQLTEPQRQEIITRSAELGAPQPNPLPIGYGEKPNAE